jgi:putative iron-dependent peroxidase
VFERSSNLSSGQTGIFALGDASHGFFEFALHEGVAIGDVIRTVANLRAAHTTVSGTNVVVGFRPELWRSCGALPAGVHGFNDLIAGPDGFAMPATQADAFVWLAAREYDGVFDLGVEIVASLAPYAALIRESSGWSYRRSRDLTGFEDGTENPTLYEAPKVALIPSGVAGEGGSILLFQQWRHDTARWNALAQARQEEIIGRTKPDSIEFPEATMPADSHVSRSTLEKGGVELPIFRRNVLYGNVSEHGTMFIGFAAEQRRLHDMLAQMAGADGGPRDALTRYTTPLTGAYYFCPSPSALARFVIDES